MKTLLVFTLLMSASYLTGCATVVPNELVDARSSYQLASDGPAKQFAPAELHKAQQALDLAEQSFLKEPDSYKTKDLAYVAQRKSQQAGVIGAIATTKEIKNRANADFQMKQAEIVKQGKEDLIRSEKQTADAQAELLNQAALKAAKERADADFQMQQAKIAQGKKDLSDAEKRAADAQAEVNKQAAVKAAEDKANAELQKQQAAILLANQNLKDSEKRTADALAALASLASLKEEERGLVVTLSGSVLFRSAEATLLSPAMVKLDQVVKALLSIRTRNLIVEGHTDSQGAEDYNQRLSQRRADAVRDYLVQKGYPSDHIQSRGQGESSPIASNATAEGRANNRRVEIVIEREPQISKK